MRFDVELVEILIGFSIERSNWEESVAEINTTNATENELIVIQHQRYMYLITYASIELIFILFFLMRSVSFFRMCLRISIKFHDMIFRGVTRAKMTFFTNNPSGRILNRFARDINHVDSMLPNSMFDVIDVSKLLH